MVVARNACRLPTSIGASPGASGAGRTTCASAESCTASRPAQHANADEGKHGNTCSACLPRRAARTAGLQTRSSWSSTTLRTRRPRSPSWYTRATRLHGFKPKWRAVRSCVRIAIAAARTCVQADPGAWTSSHACPPTGPSRDGTSVSSSITFSTLRVSGAGKRTSWSSNSTT